MGTEQKENAGMMALRLEAARVAQAADSLSLASCSSPSSLPVLAWKLSAH